MNMNPTAFTRLVEARHFPATINTPDGKVVKLSIVRKPETDEWVVNVYIDGKHSEDATYYTDDEQDAVDTRRAMAAAYEENSGVTNWRDTLD